MSAPAPARGVLATICARGGSKGIPGKNLRPFAGRPLIDRTLEQARRVGLFDAVAVSSDSREILERGRLQGASHLVLRPAALATDEAGKLPAIRHCLAAVEEERGAPFEFVVDLQVTSPLRRDEDIVACLDLVRSGAHEVALTVTPAEHSPEFTLIERKPTGVALVRPRDPPVLRRQDGSEFFVITGAAYAWTRAALVDGAPMLGPSTGIHVTPRPVSVDLDSEIDWLLAELLLERAGG